MAHSHRRNGGDEPIHPSVEWEEIGDGDDDGDDPWALWNQMPGGLKKLLWVILALFALFIIWSLVDWRVAAVGAVIIGFPLLLIGAAIGAAGAKSGGDHGDKKAGHGAGGHSEEGSGHGHKPFLTKTSFFLWKWLGSDDEVIWVNRFLAKRGGKGEAHDKGWYSGDSLRLGRLAFGIPWFMEPEWIVDMSSQEDLFTFSANPGAERMKVRLRVTVGVDQLGGRISPRTARRLVTELDRDTWAAIKDRAQSGFQDMLARLGITSSLQLEPASWRELEEAMLDDEVGHSGGVSFQDTLRHIGFRASVLEIQDVSSAVAEESKEIQHMHDAGVHPNVAAVVRGFEKILGGRGGGRKGAGKKGGRSGGGDSDAGHSDDDED